MNYFYVIGNGYIADKHYEAITKNDGIIRAVLDPIPRGNTDKYDIDIKYFNKERKFFKYLENDIVASSNNIVKDKHYVVILTPNYLHYKYIMKAVNYCDVICEKPLVIKYNHYIRIMNYVRKLNEDGIRRNVYQIEQLRLLDADYTKRLVYDNDVNEIEVNYSVSRGDWYDKSWKSNYRKSGGLLYNIGVHPVDYIIYVFGKPDTIELLYAKDKENVFIFKYIATLKPFEVRFYISVSKKPAKRVISFYNKDGMVQKIELSISGHNEVYSDILSEGEKSKFNIKYFNYSYKTLGGQDESIRKI